ncbi:MAG TPA: PadR family transcriptional regulator [Dissulfurispiraceae bacterium]|nr:PadR family transcriptional regulator [Dissulfurispiraceae bacterium]
MIRDLFLGFIRIHILHHAAKDPIYGLWLIEELNHHGYKVGPGMLYPALHKLEQAGLLKSYKEVRDGKVRKYYRTTPKGARMLAEAKKKIDILVEEINE